MKQKRQRPRGKNPPSNKEAEKLLGVARLAFDRAYAPYSRFQVGAALLTESGDIFGGCNVENASYGATICAERSAVVSAVSQGHKKIKSVCVVTDAPEPWPPCGICRQVLVEFCDPQATVVCCNLSGVTKTFTIKELCPQAFTQDQLKESQPSQSLISDR